MGMRFGQRQHPGKVIQIDADAQCVCDLVGAHESQNLIQAAGKIGKIEVTVRVDEHVSCAPDARSATTGLRSTGAR